MKKINRKALIILSFILSIFQANAQMQGVSVHVTTPACQGTEIFFTFSSSYVGGISQYVWKFGDQTPELIITDFSDTIVSHIFNSPGVFNVRVKVYFDNQIDSIVVPIQIHAAPSADFLAVGTCIDSTANFTNTTLTNNGGEINHFLWNFGDGQGDVIENPKHNYQNPGVYQAFLIVENTQGCRDTSSTKSVNVYRLPEAKISTLSTQICEGSSIRLSVSSYYSNYLWSTGTNDTLNYIDLSNNLVPGIYEFYVNIYEIHIQDMKECSSKDSIEIAVHSKPNDLVISVMNTSTNTNITENPQILLNQSIQFTVSSPAYSLNTYHWNPSNVINDPYIYNPTSTPQTTTNFSVDVVDNFGCSGKASVEVVVKIEGEFYISNIVTPNGDGHNDTWIVGSDDIFLSNEYSVIIYTRWGEEVLNQEGYRNDWNGRSNGKDLPAGAYYYLIKHGSFNTYSGSISLMR